MYIVKSLRTASLRNTTGLRCRENSKIPEENYNDHIFVCVLDKPLVKPYDV